jgi:hypothetical protein
MLIATKRALIRHDMYSVDCVIGNVADDTELLGAPEYEPDVESASEA